MILVTLGTGDKPFSRILEVIEKEIANGNIKDEVVVQVGCTKYSSKNMKIFDLVSLTELEELIKKSDLLITHGGVGSILMGLKQNKKIIGVARLKKYGEAVSDHQQQILENFRDRGLILYLEDIDNLNELILKSKKFKPKKYESNTKNMIKLLEEYIDECDNI